MAIPTNLVFLPQNANSPVHIAVNDGDLRAVKTRIAELESGQIHTVVGNSGEQRCKKRPGRGGILQCKWCRKAKRGTKVIFLIRQL